MVKNGENSIFINAFRGNRSSFLDQQSEMSLRRVVGEYNTARGNKPVRPLVRKLPTRHPIK